MKCKVCNSTMTLEQNVIVDKNTMKDNNELLWVNTYKCTNKDCGCITKVWKYINTDTQEVIREEQTTFNLDSDTTT